VVLKAQYKCPQASQSSRKKSQKSLFMPKFTMVCVQDSYFEGPKMAQIDQSFENTFCSLNNTAEVSEKSHRALERKAKKTFFVSLNHCRKNVNFCVWLKSFKML
jgi:hypothetical protein